MPHRIRRKTVPLVAALALLAGGAGIAFGASDRTDTPLATLASDLNAILADPGAAGSESAVVVRDADGNVLYTHNPDERLMPASNAKLFTSTAALDLLGPDFRFTTNVLTDSARHGPVLSGDLYLRGGGDPTTLAADYDSLASQVAKSGIRYVTGHLVADDSYLDDVRLGTGWAWDDEPYYYDAQISGLTVAPNTDYDSGTVIVQTLPGAHAGDKPKLTLVPQNGVVHLVNNATTTASGDDTISVDRTHGDSNDIIVSGNIPLGSDVDQEWATVWDPTSYAADVFRRALTAHGIRVLGSTQYAKTPAQSTIVATHQSMDLAHMYIPFLKLSNNMHAETLLKTMGKTSSGQGTWYAGLAAEETDLQKQLGVDTSGMQLVDGSGLSRMELVTAQQISNVLVAAQHRPWFDTWYNALPISAQSDRFVGGTLRNRMVGTPAAGKVHAKTGSLTGVTALSGYVIDADGKRLIFSIMQNNLVGFDGEKIEDEIAVRLAEYGVNSSVHGVPKLPAGSDRPVPATQYGPAGIECSWAKLC
jgi:serine-type D-Ala-D-Ala carboxypeptidase/endopeptidase (penicillin-binding protein 4)